MMMYDLIKYAMEYHLCFPPQLESYYIDNIVAYNVDENLYYLLQVFYVTT